MTETPFSPIHPNPYIVGNPVRDPAMFFGREKDFEFVAKRFKGTKEGGLIVFCGERRSGKTSILCQILGGRLGTRFLPILIDMQAMAVEDERQFCARVTTEVIAALESLGEESTVSVPGFSESRKPAAVFLEFMGTLLKRFPHRKPILLFDEYELIETKLDEGQLSEDFLLALAHLMESAPVYVVFTGSQHLDQRSKSYWDVLLPRSLHQRVSYLHRDDALELITRPLADQVSYSEPVIERIYRLAAGQPFYTQAICQNVVDSLNENHTRTVTDEIIDEVVGSMVDAPLPQMIFLWSDLKRNQKLALALLAESLESATATATAENLVAVVRSKKYPVELGRDQIATALEELFQEELLFKDSANPAGYSFRMDLWRLWIVRMHTVWQVMQEEGIEPIVASRRPLLAVIVGAVVVGLAVGYVLIKEPPPPPPQPPPAPVAAVAVLMLTAHPPTGVISLDGESRGRGRFHGRLEALVDHEFRISAPGYVDTTFVVHLERDGTESRDVSLRPLLSSMLVRSIPSGARVTVDGVLRGTAPVTVEGLAVPEPHEVTAEAPGYHSRTERYRVVRDSISTYLMKLDHVLLTVEFRTAPRGAAILLDGAALGRSPVSKKDIRPGEHRVEARLARHESVDTLLVLSSSGSVDLTLPPEPPGIIIVKGNHPATFYIDGDYIIEDVQNSDAQSVRAGEHSLRVRLRNGDEHERVVEVAAGETVTWNFSADTIARTRPERSE